jgi:hypothetical protein
VAIIAAQIGADRIARTAFLFAAEPVAVLDACGNVWRLS